VLTLAAATAHATLFCMRTITRRLFLKVYESKDPPPMDESALDSQLYSLLTQCFTRDPEQRPSATQLKQHGFMQRGPQY
jgi:serine/threonine protein kinase